MWHNNIYYLLCSLLSSRNVFMRIIPHAYTDNMPVVLYFSNFCLFFIGMILSLIVYIMLQSEDYESAANGLKYVLQLIPHFSITFGFMRFSDLVLENNRCKIETISCPQDDICCGKSALPHPLTSVH